MQIAPLRHSSRPPDPDLDPPRSGSAPIRILPDLSQISRFLTFSAFFSMKARRGST